MNHLGLNVSRKLYRAGAVCLLAALSVAVGASVAAAESGSRRIPGHMGAQ